MKEKTKKQFSVMRLALMLFAFVFTSQLFAQREVAGTVRDANGEPLMSAQVRVPGTDVGTITDFDGNYTLTVPEGATSLEVVPIGVDPMTVNITGTRVDVNFTRKSATDLDEVVVIGYGTTAKRDVVTSVASVSAEQLAARPVTSAAEAMQGQMAGVNVVTEDGSPDASISIRVRGGSSLTQNADPLYIVDGMPVNNINDISPSDIKSIDVLKDAASTAIYGAQGANGVIIITTKDAGNKGDKFTWNVDYTGYMGWKKQAKKWDMMSAEEFIRLKYEFAYLNSTTADNAPKMDWKKFNSNFSKYFDEGAYQPVVDGNNNPVLNDDGSPKMEYKLEESDAARHELPNVLNYWKDQPTRDWQDETFGLTGTNSNHSVTASAGNKFANFRLSYNRIDDKGIMYQSDYTRNNVTLKANFKPIKDLSIQLTGRYVNTEVLGAGATTDKLNEGSKTESRVRNSIAYTPITFLSKSLGDDDEFSQDGGMFDPLTVIRDNYKLKNEDRYVISGKISYKFLKDFTFETSLSYDWLKKQEDRYYGITSSKTRNGDGKNAGTWKDPATGKSVDNTGMPATEVRNDESTTFQNTNTLGYKKQFGNGHNFGLLIGEETLYETNDWYRNTTYGYTELHDARYTLDHASSIPAKYRFPEVAFIDPNDNMLSFFGRVDYDYYGRYYLTATMRADASTRFEPENRWGYFPSMAVA
ncbi:MAG: SusC/RagA family TonB-linked outer membrane protein, partial [Prevotellaceae bacterium]|nr:SusC/RagA family TonB-linked outer membrane protein [Prevotellaceae bacterium]